MTDGTFRRVLITGSRNWQDWRVIWDALDAAYSSHPALTVVHGACPTGADRLAAEWYRQDGRRTARIEPHPAEWRRDGCFDKSAGFTRNAEMVSLGADLCLAFLMPCADKRCRRAQPHGSHGASHTADLAEKAGIETRRFTP